MIYNNTLACSDFRKFEVVCYRRMNSQKISIPNQQPTLGLRTTSPSLRHTSQIIIKMTVKNITGLEEALRWFVIYIKHLNILVANFFFFDCYCLAYLLFSCLDVGICNVYCTSHLLKVNNDFKLAFLTGHMYNNNLSYVGDSHSLMTRCPKLLGLFIGNFV